MRHLIEIILKEPAVAELLGGLIAAIVVSEVLPFIKRLGGNGIVHAFVAALSKKAPALELPDDRSQR